MEYTFFFGTKTSKSTVYFTLTEHLHLDKPHFRCSGTARDQRLYIRQCRDRKGCCFTAAEKSVFPPHVSKQKQTKHDRKVASASMLPSKFHNYAYDWRI